MDAAEPFFESHPSSYLRESTLVGLIGSLARLGEGRPSRCSAQPSVSPSRT